MARFTGLAQAAPSTLSPLAEKAAVGLLCAAVIAGPLALGGTGFWARFAIEAAMAAAAMLWALAGRRAAWSLLLPIGLGGLLLFQLLPLPNGVLMSLAPVSAGRWKATLEGMPSGWSTISVTPAATAAAICRAFLGAATIAAATSLARTPAHRRWFYTALAIAAGLIWAAGIAFPVDPANRSVMGLFSLRGPIEFWKTPERGPLQTAGFCWLTHVKVGGEQYQADDAMNGDGFGTYIYSNHYANALCLTLPAAWALWMLYTRNRLPAAARGAVLIGSMLLAGWTTGGMAQSRAGTGAIVFAEFVYLALIAQGRWLRWTVGGLAAVFGVGLIGFMLAVQGPLSGLLQVLADSLEISLPAFFLDSRVGAAKMAGRMFLASPILGTGLGSYGDLYAVMQRSDHTMYYAHNDYAQLLAECGLLGMAVLGLAVWTLGTRFVRFCRERPPEKRLVDAAAWASLAGAAAHAVFDWNMHAPANALIACIVAGLALSSVVPRSSKPAADDGPAWGLWAARGLFAMAAMSVVPLLARDAATGVTLDTLRRANTAARVAALKPGSPSAVPALTEAIALGTSEARLDPSAWQLSMMLGHATVHLAQAATDAADRESLRQKAEAWFRMARRASAAPRGLPEPLLPGGK
jgi:hypothetical protein